MYHSDAYSQLLETIFAHSMSAGLPVQICLMKPCTFDRKVKFGLVSFNASSLLVSACLTSWVVLLLTRSMPYRDLSTHHFPLSFSPHIQPSAHSQQDSCLFNPKPLMGELIVSDPCTVRG